MKPPSVPPRPVYEISLSRIKDLPAGATHAVDWLLYKDKDELAATMRDALAPLGSAAAHLAALGERAVHRSH